MCLKRKRTFLELLEPHLDLIWLNLAHLALDTGEGRVYIRLEPEPTRRRAYWLVRHRRPQAGTRRAGSGALAFRHLDR
jgi:hypothetical protein